MQWGYRNAWLCFFLPCWWSWDYRHKRKKYVGTSPTLVKYLVKVVCVLENRGQNSPNIFSHVRYLNSRWWRKEARHDLQYNIALSSSAICPQTMRCCGFSKYYLSRKSLALTISWHIGIRDQLRFWIEHSRIVWNVVDRVVLLRLCYATVASCLKATGKIKLGSKYSTWKVWMCFLKQIKFIWSMAARSAWSFSHATKVRCQFNSSFIC